MSFSLILSIIVLVFFLTIPTLILVFVIFLDKKLGTKEKQISKQQNLVLPMPVNHSFQTSFKEQNNKQNNISNNNQQIYQKDISDTTLKYSADIFLYIGSFLVIFAIFVLVAVNWTTISNLVKSFILISVIFIFFALGFIFSRIDKIKNVGLTYYTVASLLIPLVFLGLWNFLFIDILNSLNLSIGFSLYWFFISIISLLANLLLLKFTDKSRFFYLILFSIYSLFVSFSYTLVDDTKLRLVIVVLLNLFFYLSEGFFGKYSQPVTIISRIINTLLNLLLYFNVFYSLVYTTVTILESLNIYNKLIILFALFLPTIFVVISHIKNKAYFESGLEAVLLFLKLYSVIYLFFPTNERVLDFLNSLTSIIVALFYVLISELRIKKDSKALYYFLLSISGLVLLIYNFKHIIGSFLYTLNDIYDYIAVILGLFITLFTSLFIPLKNKNYTLAGVGLTYFILFITRLIYFFDFGRELKVYTYFYLILGIVLGSLYLYFKYVKQYNFARFVNFTFELFLFFSGLFAFFSFKNVDISVVFLTITIFYFFRSLLERNDYIRLFSYLCFFIGFSGLVNLIFDNNINLTVSQSSIFFMVVSFLFYIAFEFINRFLKIYYFPEIIANIIFSVVGLLISFIFFDENILWVNLFLIFLMLSSNLVLHKSRITLFFDFLVLQVIVILSASILNASFLNSLIAISLINFLLGISNLLSKPIQNLLNLQKNESLVKIPLLLNYLNLFTVGYIALLFVILFFPVFLITTDPRYSIVLILFASTIVTAKSFKIQQFAGVPLVAAAWILANLYDLNIQFYIIPITIYTLVLAVFYYFKRRNTWSEFLELGAYIFQMFTLLIQSIFAFSELERIVVGTILIIVSVFLLVIGSLRSKKSIWISALVFMLLELFIRLLVVIVLIPWWAYIGIIGIVLMVVASFIIYRISSKE